MSKYSKHTQTKRYQERNVTINVEFKKKKHLEEQLFLLIKIMNHSET